MAETQQITHSDFTTQPLGENESIQGASRQNPGAVRFFTEGGEGEEEEEKEEEGLTQGHALGNTAAQPCGRKAVCLEPLQAVTVDTPGSGLPVPLLWQ